MSDAAAWDPRTKLPEGPSPSAYTILERGSLLTTIEHVLWEIAGGAACGHPGAAGTGSGADEVELSYSACGRTGRPARRIEDLVVLGEHTS